jgi:hypothetical protein
MANDNVRGTVLSLIGKRGSAQRWHFLTALGRKTIEATVLFLVVATLAQNLWLAFAVTAADLALHPVADRAAAWGWGQLFAGHRPFYSGGHAD